MNPRESMEFFRILGHTAGATKEPENIYSIGYGIGLTLMCALKVKRPELYKSLGKGAAPHNEIAQIFKQLSEPDSAREWILIYLGGFTDNSHAFATLKSVDLLPDNATEESIQKKADYYVQSRFRGHSYEDLYPQIYAQIESTEFK
jgi:hypothetical protein